MLLGEVYDQIHAKHKEATETKDLETVAHCAHEYGQLLNQQPDDPVILFALATAQMQLGQSGMAVALFEKCHSLEEMPEVWNNLGTAHKADNRNEKAQYCWERAMALREDADYYNNMVTLYVNEGKPAQGLKWADKGMALAPENARLRWNRALLLLELGRWEEGFKDYEYGFKSLDRPDRVYTNPPELAPMWDGTPGKRIVVWGEQGIGDELMFASAIPDLMNDCEVILDCHPRLVGLFQRSFGVKCYGTRKENAIEWPLAERIDARVAIGSLFKFYRPAGDFPRTPYLTPNPYLVAQYRARMEALGPGPYVGVSWQAGSKTTRADLRSLKISHFEPIFKRGGTFVSLQYTEGALEKCNRYLKDSGIQVHHWPEVVEAGPGEGRYPGMDYDHTVALIEALDLVICPNTTAVHACGAIGKECWTITPDAPAWRYQLQGDKMPMYESVTQFRGRNAIERIAKTYKKRRDSWTRAEPLIRAAG